MSKEGDLKIWHNSNFGHPSFEVRVSSIEKGNEILSLLADYDLYLGEDRVPMNAQGIMRFEDDEWCEVEDSERLEQEEI